MVLDFNEFYGWLGRWLNHNSIQLYSVGSVHKSLVRQT